MSDPSLSCEKAWIGVSDYQGEGHFLNVSRNTYEDVFVYEKDVGVNLIETKWMEFEPSGGVIENCVSNTFNRPVLLLDYTFLRSSALLFDDVFGCVLILKLMKKVFVSSPSVQCEFNKDLVMFT